MSANEGICIFCGNNCEKHRGLSDRYTEFVCDNCGNYTVSDLIQPLSFKNLSIMYYYQLNKRLDNGKDTFFVEDDTKFQSDLEANYIGFNTLEHLYPQNLNEQIDMILLNLSSVIKFVGNAIIITDDEEKIQYTYQLFFIDESNGTETMAIQLEGILDILREIDFIKHIENLEDDENSYTLTVGGWNRVQELQANSKVLPQSFIAMCFNQDMFAARKAIQSAVEKSGYIPVFIDMKEHNNQIIPEIFYEIRHSSFVIADLTYHRNGVYYEAGYAEALGKTVILTCRESDFEDRHFDVAQKNTIVWTDVQDLLHRLIKRIEATVGIRDIK